MIRMIHMIATLFSLLPILLMIFLMWGVINFLCLWIMIRKFYVILILLSLFMIPLKFFYEKGTYAYRYFNNIKFPLFVLKVLKLHLFCLRMLIALCFN